MDLSKAVLYVYMNSNVYVFENIHFDDNSVQEYLNDQSDSLCVRSLDNPSDPNFGIYEKTGKRIVYVSPRPKEVLDNGGSLSLWLIKRNDELALSTLITHKTVKLLGTIDSCQRLIEESYSSLSNIAYATVVEG